MRLRGKGAEAMEKKKLLEIKDLHVSAGEKEILRGVDLTLGADETHVLMGPNGTGKSTLGYAITGNPEYTVTGGSIVFNGADIVLEGVNPSCGDDIYLKLKTDGDIITDGAFVGDGCAISQASADIMLGMVIGRRKEEALEMGEKFMRMIKGEASDEEIESLEEASALKDISHMPARVKCAVLGWRTLKEALDEEQK